MSKRLRSPEREPARLLPVRVVWGLLFALTLLAIRPLVLESAPPDYGPVVHVVQWGENLTSIAARYGVSIYDIVNANRLSDPNRIYVGQRLVIPLPPAPSPDVKGATRHVVQTGDTLSALAVRYHTTVDAIVQANHLLNPSYIYVGQVLLIPATGSARPGSGVYYTVRAGDTLAGIAYRYRVTVWSIVQANNLQNPAVLRVGDSLFIPGAVEVAVAESTPTLTPTLTATVTSKPTFVPRKTDLSRCTPPPLSTPTAYPTCAVPTATPIPLGRVPLPSPAPPKPLHMNSPAYGMEVHLWGMGDCVTDRDLRLVKEAGFTWVKQLFKWRDIEIEKGQFNWDEADRIVAMVAKYNLDLCIAVAYQPEWAGGNYPRNGPPRNMADFAEFMAALARRYKGLVRAYEIWPGPNVSENWGGEGPDYKRYAEMLIDAYWYVKKEDPYAMIISGGLVQTARWDWSSVPPLEFFKDLYSKTDAPYACDVWGVEALGYLAAPENTPDEAANPELNNHYPATRELNRTWCFRSIEVLHEYTLPPERPIKKQWVVTRMGWTTDPRERSHYHWAAVSEKVKADYLRRAYRWAKENWSDWVGVMFVPLTNARWTPDDDEYWWGVVNPDGCPRPAYYTLKAMSK